MNSGLKVHAIEQDAKQSTASYQLGKIVPSSMVRAHSKPEEAEVKEEKVVEVKCGK